MHLLQDENGNLIPHGKEVHEHHHEETGNRKENLALLNYMLDHNEHHAAELEEMAGKLEKTGYHEEARQIREGVDKFKEGNALLKKAVETMEKNH